MIPPAPTSGSAPVSTPATALISIQTEAHAQSMLYQRRPKYKYTGDNRKYDFESHMRQYEILTKVVGATDAMRLVELPHWFGGTAALIVDRFLADSDTKEALSNAIAALKREFGRKKRTAKEMLQELISGEKFTEKEFSQIKNFIIQLERIHKVAVDTQRAVTFDTAEMYSEIIRGK